MCFLTPGGIFDSTKSFNTVYYVNCCVYLLTSGLYVPVILLNRYRPTFVFPEGGVSHQRFINEHDEETIIMEKIPGSHRIIENGEQTRILQNGLAESINTLESTQQTVLNEYKKRKVLQEIGTSDSTSTEE